MSKKGIIAVSVFLLIAAISSGVVYYFFFRKTCPDNCSDHGTCEDDLTCTCDSGYTGDNCSVEAADGDGGDSDDGDGDGGDSDDGDGDGDDSDGGDSDGDGGGDSDGDATDDDECLVPVFKNVDSSTDKPEKLFAFERNDNAGICSFRRNDVDLYGRVYQKGDDNQFACSYGYGGREDSPYINNPNVKVLTRQDSDSTKCLPTFKKIDGSAEKPDNLFSPGKDGVGICFAKRGGYNYYGRVYQKGDDNQFACSYGYRGREYNPYIDDTSVKVLVTE